MRGIARLSGVDRSDLFREVAAARHLQPAIVEKDFWVCLALDLLFHESAYAGSIVFKGGTSLSKAFGLIERFSEDVDLILDWRVLGYGKDEPWGERSNSAQERFKADAARRTEEFLAHELAPAMRELLSEATGSDVDVHVGDAEETVSIVYPRAFSSGATLDSIRLEVGPLAAWSPSAVAPISPYAAEDHPELFSRPSTKVRTAAPARTFWEKATILHQEANRPEGKPMPRRYARHYYDMRALMRRDVLESALSQPELLASVVAFKEKFYRTPWARLDEARPGSIRLVPPAFRIPDLRRDYEAMKPMIWGDVPALEDLLGAMRELEGIVNG